MAFRSPTADALNSSIDTIKKKKIVILMKMGKK